MYVRGNIEKFLDKPLIHEDVAKEILERYDFLAGEKGEISGFQITEILSDPILEFLFVEEVKTDDEHFEIAKKIFPDVVRETDKE